MALVPAIGSLIAVEDAADLAEIAIDPGAELGIGRFRQWLQEVMDPFRTLDIGAEIRKIRAAIAILLAGNLGLGDLLDQPRGAPQPPSRTEQSVS
jgi:hypothetical protein